MIIVSKLKRKQLTLIIKKLQLKAKLKKFLM